MVCLEAFLPCVNSVFVVFHCFAVFVCNFVAAKLLFLINQGKTSFLDDLKRSTLTRPYPCYSCNVIVINNKEANRPIRS